MRPDLELAIRNLLVIGQPISTLAEQITERLLRNSPTFREKRGFLQFLIHAGQYKSCYQLFENWFKNDETIPWQELLDLIYVSGLTPPRSEFLNFLFEALDKTEGYEKLEVFFHWAKFDKRFAEMAEKYLAALENEAQAAESRLFEKLEYFRTHRMLEQEEELLKDLIQRYPDKESYRADLKKLATRWAHNFVSERAQRAEQQKLFTRDLDADARQSFSAHLLIVMKEALKRFPSAAYDFAIGLHMLEFYEAALSILRSAVPNLAVDWFRAELLLKSRRYLECLEELANLEASYSHDPESSFAATYMRAHVFKGLGQKNMAVDLLKSIINVRPSYRSARGLLVEWERES